MQLSITTDYATDTGNPEPYLRKIAEAGFTHIHWCHQWNTDFLYTPSEVREIRGWLQRYDLQLLDLHGSLGIEKNWVSLREHERLAGVDLVANRIDMTADLGGDAVIMHVGHPPAGQEQAHWQQLQRSLDTLAPQARRRSLRIALENWDNWSLLGRILDSYPPDTVGLCYDSGHGNLFPGSLERLAAHQDRLISIHLHDNDGDNGGNDQVNGDQHKLPFSGTIPWERLVGILAGSAYGKCINLEVKMIHTGIEDERTFLERAFEAGTRLSRMLAGQRQELRRLADMLPAGASTAQPS